MAEDVIRARRIELLDSEGNTSIILQGEGSGAAGLMISTPGEDAPKAAIMLDREDGRPHILLEEKDSDAHIFASIRGGQAYLRLRNADGSELTLTPE